MRCKQKKWRKEEGTDFYLPTQLYNLVVPTSRLEMLQVQKLEGKDCKNNVKGDH